MLILVSSNYRSVYAQNILDLTANPEGAIMHFRYQEHHVEPSLWKKLPEAGASQYPALVDTRTFSVFFDQSKIEFQPEDQSLPRERNNVMYPVRSGTVERIYRDANVAHVFYRVGRYLPLVFEPHKDWEEADIPRIRQEVGVTVDRISDKLKSFLNWNHKKRRHFLQEKSEEEFCNALSTEIHGCTGWDSDENAARQQASWVKLVWILSMSKFFARTIFFRAGALYRTAKEGRRHPLFGHPRPTVWRGDEPYKSVPIVSIRPWIRGWRLDLAVSHRLELYTFQSPVADTKEARDAAEEDAEISVTLNEKLFVSDGPATRMSISYDSHPFDFQPVFGEPDGLSKLKVTAFPTKPPDEESGPATAKPEADKKMEKAPPTPPAGTVYLPYEYGPRCPEIEVWVETVHNVTYLERAAYPAAGGTIVLFAAAADSIVAWFTNALNALPTFVPCSSLAPWGVETFWVQLGLRAFAAILLLRSVVIAVRKLPTPRM